MTPDETGLLTTFLMQLTQAGTVGKDPQAASLIADAVARQPDAAYLLVQRSLLQDRALTNATARIASLEEQLRATPAAGGSFLDGGNNAWGRAAVAPTASPVAPAGAFNAAPLSANAPAPSRFFGGGGLGGGLGGGSFLTNMAATAAGVAGGAFLFQGIENLMGHHGSNHMMDSQTPFGGMADSVDHVAADAPSARDNLVDSAAASEPADLTDTQSGLDDSSAGSDDSLA